MENDIGQQAETIMRLSAGHKEFLSAARSQLFKVLHEIVFFGKGGYDFDTVYNMPIWLRKFVYHSMNSYYEEEARQAEAAKRGKSLSPKVPKVPANLPIRSKVPDLKLKSHR